MPQVKHVVLLRCKADVPAAEVEDVFDRLAALEGKVPGLIDFSGGPYRSPEGLNQGYTHGFMMTFADEASRELYLDHPEHEAVKRRVLELLDGGLDAVAAFDWLCR